MSSGASIEALRVEDEMRLRNPSLALAGAALLATVAAQNAHATVMQVSPGPTVTGVAPPPNIQNGSTPALLATGTIVNAVFVGEVAADGDILTVTGHPEFTPIDNLTTPPGSVSTATGLTSGQVVPFLMTNTNTGDAYAPGTVYANTIPPFTPVYHYAEFTGITDAADFNASPLAILDPTGVTITPGGSVDTYLIAHGGYSSYLFVGVEDLNFLATDDWNDLVYAFQFVTPVVSTPEPASMLVLGSALLGFGVFRRRRNRK
jgi:PEP-CTERM motif